MDLVIEELDDDEAAIGLTKLDLQVAAGGGGLEELPGVRRDHGVAGVQPGALRAGRARDAGGGGAERGRAGDDRDRGAGRHARKVSRGDDWEFVWASSEQGRIPPLFDAIAWHEGNSGGRTHPVGEKTPNAWGLRDTHGNVSEWMQSWHGWPEQPPQALLTDPKGPAGGDHKNVEGCNWDDDSLGCDFSGSIASVGSPDDRSNRTGFRLARRVSKEHQ